MFRWALTDRTEILKKCLRIGPISSSNALLNVSIDRSAPTVIEVGSVSRYTECIQWHWRYQTGTNADRANTTEIKTTDFCFILIDTKHVLYNFYCVAYVYLVKVHTLLIYYFIRGCAGFFFPANTFVYMRATGKNWIVPASIYIDRQTDSWWVKYTLGNLYHKKEINLVEFG